MERLRPGSGNVLYFHFYCALSKHSPISLLKTYFQKNSRFIKLNYEGAFAFNVKFKEERGGAKIYGILHGREVKNRVSNNT